MCCLHTDVSLRNTNFSIQNYQNILPILKKNRFYFTEYCYKQFFFHSSKFSVRLQISNCSLADRFNLSINRPKFPENANKNKSHQTSPKRPDMDDFTTPEPIPTFSRNRPPLYSDVRASPRVSKTFACSTQKASSRRSFENKSCRIDSCVRKDPEAARRIQSRAGRHRTKFAQ